MTAPSSFTFTNKFSCINVTSPLRELLVQGDKDISESDVEDLVSLFSGSLGMFDHADEGIKDMLAYQGLGQAKITISTTTLVKNAKAWKSKVGKSQKVPIFTYNIMEADGSTKTVELNPLNSALKDDLTFLIVVTCYRGVNLQKILDKSQPELVLILKTLMEKYKIDVTVRKPGSSLRPDVVTLARIRKLFPVLVIKNWHFGNYKSCLTWSDTKLKIPNQLEKEPYSAAWLCEDLPAVVPTCIYQDIEGLGGVTALMMWIAVLYDDLYKPGSKTPLSKIYSNIEAAYKSKWVSEANRIQACVKIHLIARNLIYAEGTPNAYSVSALPGDLNSQAKVLVLAHRPDDKFCGKLSRLI